MTWRENPDGIGMHWRSERDANGWGTPVLAWCIEDGWCTVTVSHKRHLWLGVPSRYDACARPVRWLPVTAPSAPRDGRLPPLPIGTKVARCDDAPYDDGVVVGVDDISPEMLRVEWRIAGLRTTVHHARVRVVESTPEEPS